MQLKVFAVLIIRYTRMFRMMNFTYHTNIEPTITCFMKISHSLVIKPMMLHTVVLGMRCSLGFVYIGFLVIEFRDLQVFILQRAISLRTKKYHSTTTHCNYTKISRARTMI